MTEQPAPVPNRWPGAHDELIESLRDLKGPEAERMRQELAARRDLGRERYGTLLQPFNGRDALRDLLEEVLDAMAYAHQVRLEDGFASLPDDGSNLETVLAGVCGAVIALIDRRDGVA